jgi:hypothetical protein
MGTRDNAPTGRNQQQQTGESMTYSIQWHNDPILDRHYVNIRRDGELAAQAVAIAPDRDNKVGIIYSVMLDGQWSKNEFEFTTVKEWVERFTK